MLLPSPTNWTEIPNHTIIPVQSPSYLGLIGKGYTLKGYFHIYTGNGKGKTTAALGLAVRAAGAGLKVYFAQFIKGGKYSELKALQRFDDLVTVEQFGLGRFIKGKPRQADIEAARQGLARMKKVVASGEYGVVILDEANVALSCGLFSLAELEELIAARAEQTELVITGRGAVAELIDKADLVTEMHEVKHYYNSGVDARVGIEK